MKLLLVLLIGFADWNALGQEHNPTQHRIIQGYNCTIEQYSHLVSISDGKSLFCAGSLIAHGWVLSTARCCLDMDDPLQSYTAIAGQNFWNKKVHQTSEFDHFVVHKDYMVNPLKHDICLLKLKTNMYLSQKVKITKLASPELYQHMVNKKQCNKLTVMAFGHQVHKIIENDASGSENISDNYNNHVQCIDLKFLYERRMCHDAVPFILSDGAFCAFDPTGSGRDSCQGDYGGPIYCNDVQIGVVSGGIGCGYSAIPGLYSRVDVAKDFIDGLVFGAFRLLEDEDNMSGVNSICFYAVLTFTCTICSIVKYVTNY